MRRMQMVASKLNYRHNQNEGLIFITSEEIHVAQRMCHSLYLYIHVSSES